MPLFSSLRILSIFAVIAIYACAAFTGMKTLYAVLFSLGLSHYLASIYYARKQIGEIFSSPLGSLRIIVLLLLSLLVIKNRISLVYTFLFHHMFNETYLLNQTVSSEKLPALRPLRTSAVFLHGFAYAFIFRWHPHIPLEDRTSLNALLVAGLVVSSVAFFFHLNKARRLLTGRELIDNCSFEILSLALCGLSFHTKIYFMQLVGYHFVFWILHPLSKLITRQAGPGQKLEIAKFLIWTVGLSGLIFYCSPVGGSSYKIPEIIFKQLFMLLSQFHIILSLGISNAHPDWLIQFFRPKKVPAPEPALVRIDNR